MSGHQLTIVNKIGGKKNKIGNINLNISESTSYIEEIAELRSTIEFLIQAIHQRDIILKKITQQRNEAWIQISKITK